MLIAHFRSPGDARAAIEALEHHGIDGVEIGVPTPRETVPRQPADRRALLHVGGRAGKGIVVGAVAGAAVFAVVGVVFLVIGWPAAAFFALVLAGAAIGGAAGAFIGVERGVGMSEGWERTFHEPGAHTVPVEVHATSTEEMATARRLLEERRPVSVREVESPGSRR
jgi:hypothetical protein